MFNQIMIDWNEPLKEILSELIWKVPIVSFSALTFLKM